MASSANEKYSAQDEKDGFIEICKLISVFFIIATTLIVNLGLEALGLPEKVAGGFGLAIMCFMAFLAFLALMIEKRLQN